VPDTLKVTAGQCYTNEKPQILMAKTHGFHKVVRASAGTPLKRQISKVVTIPVADSGIIRPIIVLAEALLLLHTNALTSEHT
jgi:predicted patatin/cPLA2 family phospholipase